MQKLSEVFRREGYNGASLADLGAAVGQSKASLYQKFPGGKAQIGAEVLTEIQQTFETRVLATLREQGTADVRFKKMLDAASEFYGMAMSPAWLKHFPWERLENFIGVRCMMRCKLGARL